MPRLRAPTHVVFLGGAGTDIGETMIDQKWFIKMLLTDDYEGAPQGNPTDFHAYFINTDTDETSFSIEKRVDDTVSEVREELENPLDIEIEATVIDFGDIDKELLNPNNVVSEQYLPPIMREVDFSAWWLKEGETVDSLRNLSSQGVNRKRGLMKALHRLGQSDADPLNDTLITDLKNISGDPEVAVFVGLGGGTGSGIVVDLAYRILKEASGNLTLFASLPAPTADDDTHELSNAYAALSELEYLELNDRKLFETIHLLPYEAHVDENSFNKAVTYALISWYNLNDAWDTRRSYKAGDENGPPQYAPFTITVPQFVRYVTEEVRETEKNVENYIEQKSKAVETEKELVETLEEAVEAIDEDAAEELVENPVALPDAHNHRLEKDKANDLRSEIEKLQELLGQSYMRRIGYHAPEELYEEIESTLETSKNEAEWERAAEQRAAVGRDFIDRLPSTVGDPEAYRPDEGWKGDEDEFINISIKQLELIRRRAGLHRAANGMDIDEPPVVETEIDVDQAQDAIVTDIKNAIDPDDSGRATQISTFIKAISDKKSEKETQRDTLDKIIDDVGPDVVSAKAENCLDDIEDDLRDYYDLYDSRKELIDLIEDLESEVADIVNQVKAATSPNTVPSSDLNFDRFVDLGEATKNRDDVTVPDEQTIKSAVRNLVRAREAHLKAKNVDETLTEKVSETIRSVIDRSEYEKSRDTYIQARRRMKGGPIEIPEWDRLVEVKPEEELPANAVRFDAGVHLDEDYFDAGVDKKLKQSRQRVVTTVEKALKEIEKKVTSDPTSLLPDDVDLDSAHLDTVNTDGDEIDVSNIEDWFENDRWGQHLPPDFDTFKEEFKTPLEKAFDAVLIEPFRKKHSQTEEEIETIEEARKRYEKIRQARTDEGSDFEKDRDDVPDTKGLSVYEVPEDTDPFKNEIDPANEGFIGSNQTLGDVDVWNNSDERQNLINALLKVLPQYGDDRLPLKEMDLSHTETTPYNGHVVKSVFLSTAFNEYRDDEEARINGIWNNLSSFEGVKEDDYSAARVPVGDDQEVGMTTFLGGIFLDNLAIAADECKKEHEKAMGRSLQEAIDNTGRHVDMDSIPTLVERYTYALDGVTYHDEPGFFSQNSDGAFPCRTKTINVNINEGKKELLDGEEEDIVEKLCNEYYRIVGYPTAIEKDADGH